MEEKDQLTIINFTNITDKDWVGMWGGIEYLIKAGETKPFVRFMSEHFAKHLANKILIDKGDDFNDESLRKPLIDKMMGRIEVKVESPVAEAPKEPEFAGIPIEENKDEPALAQQLSETEVKVVKKRGGRRKK